MYYICKQTVTLAKLILTSHCKAQETNRNQRTTNTVKIIYIKL